MPILNREKTRRDGNGRMAPRAEKVRVTPGVAPAPYFRWKGAIGRVLASILLIPALPLIGLSVLLVRLTSRGPGIYRQTRVGKDGRLFTMYKIRTMGCDAEADTGPVWHVTHDPRITRVGKLLRKCHLDELPQLFNVLKGEMHLIGPRPERPEFVEVLAKKIPGYTNRLAVRPGITGLAQINLPPDSDLQSVQRKLTLDLEYIQHAKAGLDLRLFACTSLRLLGLSGDRLLRCLRLERQFYVELGRQVHGANDDQPERSFSTPAFLHASRGNAQTEKDGASAKNEFTRSFGEAETTRVHKPR